MNKPHLFLNNPRGEKNRFEVGRNIESDEVDTKSPQSYRPQKNKLNSSLKQFDQQRLNRIRERSLRIPDHLEYIRVDFFVVFNNTEPYKTKSTFQRKFGLSPVVYSSFNQSILFAITDQEKFKNFIQLINNFIESADSKTPKGTPYSIITLIYDFEFLSTNVLLHGAPKRDVIISLVRKEESISSSFNKIYGSLIAYIQRIKGSNAEIEFSSDGLTTIELKNISQASLKLIAENFDIICRIQSLRTPTIKVNKFNTPELTWDFSVKAPKKSNIVIGILDNGVRSIKPIEDIIIDLKLDITNKSKPNPLSTQHPHGTIVSILAALGLSYFDTGVKEFQADAYILPIKILNSSTGFFSIYDIKNVMQIAIENGVRIFNLSVCGPTKMYNSIVSEYAYILDKLAYENDILIFIATGNLGYDDIEAMQANPPSGVNAKFHDYPNHFYNPYKSSINHVCEASNICIPGESYNNITVGAIAENMISGSPTGLTPFKELPAYYTLKSHIDYSRKINGSYFAPKQTNRNISKPDIVMPGGDLLKPDSGMQVIGFGGAGDYFSMDSGTSYAAPLASNLAAKITSLYPGLNMQSVKALILNNASKLLAEDFLDDLIDQIRQETSQERFNKRFNTLNNTEKRKVTEHIKSEDLYRKLVGYGMPLVNKTLYSDSKSVTTIIQDSIKVDFHKVINLNIPEYLLKYDKPSYILSIKATLCYKFLPIWNNQLGYNPIHISFNFARSLAKDDPIETASIITDNKHSFYDDIFDENATPEERAKAKKIALGIKTNLDSWSEDFFPPATKPFSNTQQLDINIKKEEIRKIQNQISILVRCTYKRDLDQETMESLMQSIHEFSIVLNISEKPNSKLSDFDLYDELLACNDLDNISIVEAEGEIEL